MNTEKTTINQKPIQLKKYMLVMVLILLLGFGGLFAGRFILIFFAMNHFGAPPPPTISAAYAKEETWQPFLSAVGHLKASDGVKVSSELPGKIEKIYFKAGQTVEKDSPLVKLDDRTAQEELKSLEAQLKLAQITYKRISKLYTKRAISKSSLDEAQAKLQEAEAMAGKTKVLIDLKLIKAPFTGKIGISDINVGEYISAGTALVNLQALNILHADFSLPEQNLNKLQVGQTVMLTTDVYPKEQFKGKISAMDSTVDPKTHNIRVRALVPNSNTRLYPGLFVNVRVILPAEIKVITVPQTSISYSLYGDAIFVIEAKGKDKKGNPILNVSRHYVKVGERRGNRIAIISGIKAGDHVVTSGQLKLQNNMRITINNRVNPDAP